MQYQVVPFRADVMEAEGACKAAEQLVALTKKMHIAIVATSIARSTLKKLSNGKYGEAQPTSKEVLWNTASSPFARTL